MIDDRGTGWGKSSRPGLWGGRRATGAFTRKIDSTRAVRLHEYSSHLFYHANGHHVHCDWLGRSGCRKTLTDNVLRAILFKASLICASCASVGCPERVVLGSSRRQFIISVKSRILFCGQMFFRFQFFDVSREWVFVLIEIVSVHVVSLLWILVLVGNNSFNHRCTPIY